MSKAGMDMNQDQWIDAADAVEWVGNPHDITGDGFADGDDLSAIINNTGQPAD